MTSRLSVERHLNNSKTYSISCSQVIHSINKDGGILILIFSAHNIITNIC